jgi:hypothetical protein
VLASRAQYLNLNAFQRKSPSRFDHNMRVARDSLLIRSVIGASDFGVFEIGAVIDEGSDLDAIHQLRNAANVVAMIVGDQNVIELLEPGLVRRSNNAVGVPAFISGPAGIDE